MYIHWFLSETVTDADDDNDNAGHHSTITRATYRQKLDEKSISKMTYFGYSGM